MAYTSEQFNSMGLKKNADGTYSKPKSIPQPREVYKNTNTTMNTSYPPKFVGVGEREIFTAEAGFVKESLLNFSIEFPVDPMGKPRMTQRDKWHKREVTDRYWELKRQVKQIAEGYNFTMPDSNYHMIFYIPMPDSWAKKKKAEMNERPHKQKPDKDNLEKAILDALCTEDSYVWDGRVSKYWAYKGKIIIKSL